MDEFGLVWLSLVWFDEVDFLKCSHSASQLNLMNLFIWLRKRIFLCFFVGSAEELWFNLVWFEKLTG